MHGEVRQINGKRVATPEYRSWQMMKNRCGNPRAQDYVRYGGRGITFDPAWIVFDAFLADMGRKPSPLHTLERIDNDRPYCKTNCVWATRLEQSRNRGAYNKCSLGMANEIRALYATGLYRQVDLAARYGLRQTDVSQITRNVRWKANEKGGNHETLGS